jgi:hypothetical protein
LIGKLKANAKERNGTIWNDDCVEVFIDPGLSRNSHYHFTLNALNTQEDEKYNGALEKEKGWNSRWESNTRISADGWTAAMRIPFSSFALDANMGSSWGINFCRQRKAEPENSSWAPVAGVFQSPEKFGVIRNLNISYAAVSQPVLSNYFHEGKPSLRCTQSFTNCFDGPRKLTVNMKSLGSDDGITKTIELARGETEKIDLALDISRNIKEYELQTEVIDSATGDITYSSIRTIENPSLMQTRFNLSCYVKQKTAHLLGTVNANGDLPSGLGISILLQRPGMPPIAKTAAISGKKFDIPVDISSVPAGNHNASISMMQGTSSIYTEKILLTKLPPFMQEVDAAGRASSMHRELSIYVSPNGNDANDGLAKEKPLKTLQAARDRVRQAIKEYRNRSIEVVLAGGVYEVPDAFELTAEDSGLPGLPVIWRGADKESAVLSGGKQLSGAFTVPAAQTDMYSRFPAEVRDKVVCYDLKAMGITDLGCIAQRGGFLPVATSQVELFYGGAREPLASYPRSGYEHVSGLTDRFIKFPEHETTRTSCLGEFVYGNDEISKWKTYDGMFMHGYWSWDWADGYKEILSVDRQKKIIRCTPVDTPDDYMAVRANGRYRILNVPEMLAEPGQYVMDFKQARIYFLPPKGK